MKNEIVCKSCGIQNPFYQLNCINCKAYLRERVYNLDLWKILEFLIESPIKGFTKIIHSEQKNFILFVIILVSLKFLINTIFFYLLRPENKLIYWYFFRNYLIILLAITIITLIFTFIIKFSNQLSKNFTRAKDIFSILTYFGETKTLR